MDSLVSLTNNYGEEFGAVFLNKPLIKEAFFGIFSFDYAKYEDTLRKIRSRFRHAKLYEVALAAIAEVSEGGLFFEKLSFIYLYAQRVPRYPELLDKASKIHKTYDHGRSGLT